MIVRGLVYGVALFVLAGVASSGQADGSQAAARARRILGLLNEGRFEEVAREFNGQMSAALSVAQLREVWSRLRQQVGAFVSVLDDQVTPAGGVTAVVLGSQFERGALNVIVAFDADHRIAGLRMTPRPVADQAAAAAPGGLKEEAVTVGSGEWALPGTLTLPAGRAEAAVVLVHGSGPNDRDETLGPNKPFRDLAWGLAQRGIAVLRYEKRTRQHGAKLANATGRFTVREEVTDDAVLAAALLRSRPGIDPARIFVLGHSLGGTLAPRIALEDRTLAGLIIMAGATRPLLDLAREQLTYLASLSPGQIDPEQTLEALRRAAPQSYWDDLNTYKPADAAARLQLPMLIVQGGRDYQVTQPDLDGWRTALANRANVTIKAYPNLNHLFMAGEGKATPAEYERPGKVADVVIEDIAAWIRRS